MVIRYWIREFEDEYRIAELRNGQIKALLESQPLAKSVWDSPIPPSGCFASLQFGELDFVLVGDLTNEDLESYSREIGPDCRAVKAPSLLDPSLKALIAGANGPCRLVSPDEPAEAATDSQIGVLLGEFGESRGESGRFTLSLDGMGAVGRHFEKPVKQLGGVLSENGQNSTLRHLD